MAEVTGLALRAGRSFLGQVTLSSTCLYNMLCAFLFSPGFSVMLPLLFRLYSACDVC